MAVAAHSSRGAREDAGTLESEPPHGLDSEEWRAIPGWEGYEASTHGNIRSLAPRNGYSWKAPRVLRGSTNDTGHRHVVLRGRVVVGVHRLGALTFLGPPPPGATVCRHFDGDPTNNRPENLRWGTPKENSDDMLRHGTRKFGEANHWARLTEQQVLDIYARRARGNARALADEMGVKEWTVYSIWSGRNWGWLTGA